MQKTEKTNIRATEVIAKFCSYYKPYIAVFIFDLICACVVAAVDLAFPQFLRFFTNDFFTRSAQEILDALIPIAIGLILMYLIRTAAQYYITRWGHLIGACMENDMRADLFNQFQRLSFSFYDKNQSGDMASRILTDLFDISELAHHGPENVLICGLKIIGSFVLLFMISVPLTSVMLVLTIIMSLYSAWTNYKWRVVFSASRRRMGQMNSQISDSLGGIRTVKSFANEKEEIKKFENINDDYLITKKDSYSFIANFNAVNSMFTGVLYTFTIVGGGFCVATGNLQVAELAIFALYIGIFIAPIELIIQFSEIFQKGYAGFKRFVEILKERPDVVEASDAIDFPHDAHTDIQYKDVYFDYENMDKNDRITALNGINLTIKEGEKLALVGPSGEGKSTTCFMLPRFYNLNSGHIYIGGIEIEKLKLESLRKMIGIVQQQIHLFTGTVAQNIAYGVKNVSFEDIKKAAKAADIHDHIIKMEDGYNTKVGERGSRLSGGQKQRIAIARLFLRDPKIIILDEATSALDNISEKFVQESLDKLCKGRTTIMIAHRLSTIKSADKIAVIHNGKVSEYGTHDELLKKNGIYKKYYDLQFA